MLVERPFAWWEKRILEDDGLPCTAGRPEASVSIGAIATAIGGPGPRLADELHRDRTARAFMARAAAANAANPTVGEIIRSYRMAEYEAARAGELSPAYLASLRRMVDEAMETASLMETIAGAGPVPNQGPAGKGE